MSQATRQFWVSFCATAIPIVMGLGVWIWQSGGQVGVYVERLSSVEKRVGQTVTTEQFQSVEKRVTALEVSDRTKTQLLAEIRTDVKWLVRREADKEDHR